MYIILNRTLIVSEDEHEHRVWKMSAVDPGSGKESPPPPFSEILSVVSLHFRSAV